VGITPQLLPAVVSTSLAAGSRRMSRRQVLVKRLVCIEDLGDVDLLFTDKTGTLTEGSLTYTGSVPVHGTNAETLTWGLLCTEQTPTGAGPVVGAAVGGAPAGGDPVAGPPVGGNPLDQALWAAPGGSASRAEVAAYERLGVLPFDHERRMVSVVVRAGDGSVTLVTKGAPETVLERCVDVPDSARTALAAEFAAGHRVVAVAARTGYPVGTTPVEPTPADERDLSLVGLLVFADPPKAGAREALARLATLGVGVKVVTGDNAVVALKVCADLGLPEAPAVSGTDLDGLDDTQLAAAIATTTVFSRVSPEHKARIVRVQRITGGGVAFLGDGVNDALALHAADVGISVDSATDVAKDAADVILLQKDLNVLADGVSEGRRIFANTMKYVLMGTSSNFGNMFSAAGASLFLPFLPMLPSQILLNNLLYDTSQLAIPTDHVDESQLRRPSHWDIRFIRRFMLFFGPFSSVFDFVTFGVMLWVFHSGPEQFRTGWFVESLATQTLIILAIRTRRIPFFRSRPSLPVIASAVAVTAVGALLPATPLAGLLGFAPLPPAFFAALLGMILSYLVLVEVGKRIFYGREPRLAVPRPAADPVRHLRRRAAYFATSAKPGVPRPRPRRAT
ncbi:MAG: Mg(2+) transport ATPase, partial [Friedmanniella sp.]|nr:Mg(2+) transport ATPase [Friedmanniella sp.]